MRIFGINRKLDNIFHENACVVVSHKTMFTAEDNTLFIFRISHFACWSIDHLIILGSNLRPVFFRKLL